MESCIRILRLHTVCVYFIYIARFTHSATEIFHEHATEDARHSSFFVLLNLYVSLNNISFLNPFFS